MGQRNQAELTGKERHMTSSSFDCTHLQVVQIFGGALKEFAALPWAWPHSAALDS